MGLLVIEWKPWPRGDKPQKSVIDLGARTFSGGAQTWFHLNVSLFVATSRGQALLMERSQKQGVPILENRELMSSGEEEGVPSGTRQISGLWFETWLHHFLGCALGQGT